MNKCNISRTLTGFQTLSGLILLLLLAPQLAFSQGAIKPAEKQYLKLNKEYLFSYLTDAKDVAIAPLRWNKNQWIGFAGFAGFTTLVYTQDGEIQQFFQRNHTGTKDNLNKYFFDPLGTWYLIPIFGSMYIYGLAAKNPKAETAALVSGKAIIIAGTYSFVFKNIFQRKRPYESDPPDAAWWGGPFNGFNYNAFPSGHTTVVFAAATALSTYYNDKLWVGLTSYTLAAMVGISRMYGDAHWASDVVAGAMLGYSIGRLVANKQKKQKHFCFAPYSNGWATGMSVSYYLK
jgi:membrane-associated phospholipid phosphatase